MNDMTEKCSCRPVWGFQNRVTGMDPQGCPIHGITLAEIEAKLMEKFAGHPWPKDCDDRGDRVREHEPPYPYVKYAHRQRVRVKKTQSKGELKTQ